MLALLSGTLGDDMCLRGVVNVGTTYHRWGQRVVKDERR